MKIIRTIFQDCESRFDASDITPKLLIVLDMEQQMGLTTKDIPNLMEKLQKALPGIFPNESSLTVHSCGGRGSGVEQHTFLEEIKRGTNIPHLFEHMLLYLLSRRSNHCSAYCGQRSIDLEQGITTHYYLVMDYPSKLEAIVAIDLGFRMLTAWIDGDDVEIEPAAVLDGIRMMIEPMVSQVA